MPHERLKKLYKQPTLRGSVQNKMSLHSFASGIFISPISIHIQSAVYAVGCFNVIIKRHQSNIYPLKCDEQFYCKNTQPCKCQMPFDIYKVSCILAV